MWNCVCPRIQKRRPFHAKMTNAKLYIYMGVGARERKPTVLKKGENNLYFNKAHAALDIPLLKQICSLNQTVRSFLTMAVSPYP